VKAFAELLDRISYSASRTAKLRLLIGYLRTTPDPDRGWALAALTGGLPFSFPLRRTLADIMQRRSDPELFRLARDYVGDTAETVALMWEGAAPDPAAARDGPGIAAPRLGEVVAELMQIDRHVLPMRLESWLDGLGPTERWALLKLLTGALRVGVSARLAKTAVAAMGGRTVEEIEEAWHAIKPPYAPLFAALEAGAPIPEVTQALVFRPLMLSHALEESDWEALDLAEFWAEWKWDGIRVQVVGGHGQTRLFSRSGDDISGSFPDIIAACRFDAVLDGELLVMRKGAVAPFGDLQQRLNRKSVSQRELAAYPAHVRLYDALLLGGADLRRLPLYQRREQLEAWHARVRPPRTDLSAIIAADGKDALKRLWAAAREDNVEGIMLKRRDSPYLAGRPKGQWYKWKRAALTLDCVLMYAQRGSGKRSSYYSDYTFGLWQETDGGGRELVTVGKAYFGFTDAELRAIDRWVRNNTVTSFGPVRVVAPQLVFEVAFDAVQVSRRHKSGVAMRFPRIHRIRWDKPAAEADHLASLVAMIRP
jgi:DNA ligase-1